MGLRFGFLVFQDIQQLDLTAAYEVFAGVPGSEMELVAQTMSPVLSTSGLPFYPTTTFDTCGRLDILCIPGGSGVNALMENEKALEFIRQQAKDVQYLTSVCSGSLVLGAAGLLKGRSAACHWNALEFIRHFGAMPVKDRIVFDGNLVTAGGVTSGVDFGLALVARLCDKETAQKIQLNLQYAPQPPFQAGTPEEAPAHIVEAVMEKGKAVRKQREQLARQWAEKNLP